MNGRKLAKKTCNTANKNETKSLLSMPVELITKIVACVAACSFFEFFNIKLSCKTLKEITESKDVLKHVSMNTLMVARWRSRRHLIDQNREEASNFFDLCVKCDNPNALYLRGIVQYFGTMKMEVTTDAITCLKKAADSGHVEAKYVNAIVYIFEGDELKQKGMEIIKELKKLELVKTKVIREKFLKLLWSYDWIHNSPIVRERKSVTCCTRHDQRDGWELFEDLDLECEKCWCDQEIRSINRVLTKSV